MKRRKRHTLLKCMILAVLAGAVIRYTGVFPDSFTPPGQIQSQVHVEQKNAKSKADSGTIEKHIKESQETGTENETPEAKVSHGYAYETLSTEQQTVYDEIYRIIMTSIRCLVIWKPWTV